MQFLRAFMFILPEDDTYTWGLILALMSLFVLLQYYQTNHRVTKKMPLSATDILPAKAFLLELSMGRSVGHDKNLLSMLHTSLLAVTERGIIRALSRFVADNYGEFKEFEDSTVTLKSNDTSCHLHAKARFEKLQNELIDVEVGWKKREFSPLQKEHLVVSFNIAAPAGKTIDLYSFINADELSSFGELVVSSLLSNTPAFAFGVMVPELKEKYASAAEIASRMRPLVDACGVFSKPISTSLTLVTSRVTKGSPRCTELTYHAEAAVRDVEVSLQLVIRDFQCYLLRYNVVAQPPKRKDVVIEV